MSYSRYAIYCLPEDAALAAFGARWLGWDVVRGAVVVSHDLPGLRDITMTPRKYGFHGTLKPPFRLAEGRKLAELEAAIGALAARTAPAVCDGLELRAIGRFIALTPSGDTVALARVAQACVTELDDFRAPATEPELARRRKAGLSPRQETLLAEWGYPYVMDQFRFHLTLSGRLEAVALAEWTALAAAHLPPLPAPFAVNSIALCGEREDGNFELIHRYTLSG